MTDYRHQVYAQYVSRFKGVQPGGTDPGRAQVKLRRLIADWLAPVDRSGRVLDLGCGDGALLQAMRQLGFNRLSGVDLSAEQVARARRVCPEVHEGQLLSYLASQREGDYAALLLFDVIEHLTKPEILELMALVASRLAPGGLFIGHCPNGDSPMAGNLHAGDFTHETLLNPSSARHLCALFGLEAFEAREHLGESASWQGAARRLAWAGLRAGLKLWNLAETGSPGSGVFTRQFAFKARRPL